MSSDIEKTLNWEYITLDEVVDKGSSNISLNKIKEDEGEYPIYSAKGFFKNISFYHQEKKYIAIIKDGAGIGRLSVHPAKSSIVGTMQYLIPKDGFDLMFVKYFLTGINFISYKQGATIPHIYFKDYKVELVPKLALEEQKRIVAKIDGLFSKIDKAISLTEESLVQAKNLLPSVLKEVFEKGKADGWEERKLEEVCEKITDGSHNPPKSCEGSKLMMLSGRNVRDNKLDFEKVRFVSENDFIREDKRTSIKVGDVLLTIVGSIGRSFVFPEGVPRVIFQRSVAVLKPYSILNPYFLSYYLKSPKIQEKLNTEARGAAQKGIYLKDIRAFLLLFPNLDIQSEKALFLDKVSTQSKKTQSKLEEQLTYLKQLKSSILSKAFKGEL
jgi:type I restriction enzyme S subunit